MSDHGHAAHAEPAGGHDYHYDGEPADRAAPDEPRTPGWLPLLGIGVVLSAMLGYIVTQPASKTREELAAAAPPAPSAPTPAAAAEDAPSPDRRPRALPSGMRPSTMPSGFPRLMGSGTPRRPGQFAVPGGSAPPRRPAPDSHAGHNHP